MGLCISPCFPGIGIFIILSQSSRRCLDRSTFELRLLRNLTISIISKQTHLNRSNFELGLGFKKAEFR